MTTSGGKIAEYNLGYDYIKALANNCYGISEVLCYMAEGLDIVGADVNKILDNAISVIETDMQI